MTEVGSDAAGWKLDAPAFLAPHAVIADKYELLEVLGQGGMAVVVKAMHLQLGVPVALKFLRVSVAQDNEIVLRFLQEARAAVQLKSEHVARVLDVGRCQDGTPFMVMEHLSGSDLGMLLNRGRPLPTE